MSLIFTDVVDVPVEVRVGPEGKQETISFPVLPSTQIVEICEKVRSDRVASIVRQCKEFKVPDQQAAYMVYKEEIADVDPMDAHRYFMTPKGVDDCLTRSLKLSGTVAGEIERILTKFTVDDKRTIAIRVAKIYKPKSPVAVNIGGTSGSTVKKEGVVVREGSAARKTLLPRPHLCAGRITLLSRWVFGSVPGRVLLAGCGLEEEFVPPEHRTS